MYIYTYYNYELYSKKYFPYSEQSTSTELPYLHNGEFYIFHTYKYLSDLSIRVQLYECSTNRLNRKRCHSQKLFSMNISTKVHRQIHRINGSIYICQQTILTNSAIEWQNKVFAQKMVEHSNSGSSHWSGCHFSSIN